MLNAYVDENGRMKRRRVSSDRRRWQLKRGSMTMAKQIIAGLCFLILLPVVWGAAAKKSDEEHTYQYEWPEKEIRIVRASSDEPKLGEFNAKLAADYIERGARIWDGYQEMRLLPHQRDLHVDASALDGLSRCACGRRRDSSPWIN